MFNAPIATRALNPAPDCDDNVEHLKVQPG
jgi:hypothetical protein